MDLMIRNKWVSLRGGSVVKDVNEQDVLRVKGKFWTVTRKKFVQTLDGETKYIVRNKFWRLFAYRAYVETPDKKKICRIRRKIFSFHDRYFITSDLGDLEIKGNILGYDYHILLNGQEIGHISRKISFRDSFVLHLEEGADPMLYVALVIAIDNITDQRNADASAAASSYSN